MTVRHYSSAAGKMILQLGITAVATAMQVDTTAGLPGATPFSLLVDVGLPTEEIVTVNQVSGNTLVVVRGEDGTSAQPHASGAVVRHAITARDLRDSRDHEEATAGVHGVTGSVVGTTDTQTLTNKNLSSPSNVFPTTLATDAELATHAADTATHGASGALVGTTNTQTLSNKTLVNPLVTPSTTAGNAQVVQGLASQAGALSAWKDSANTVLATVGKDGTFSNAASNIGCQFIGSEGTPTAQQAYIGGKDPNKFVLNVNGPTGQAFDLLRLAVNGTRLAGVQADGTVDGTNIPTSGVAGTSTTKAKKRLHWGTYSSVDVNRSDATGIEDLIPHGAGFTPTAIVITPSSIALQFRVFNITATTFDLQVINSDGSANGTSTFTFSYLCGE